MGNDTAKKTVKKCKDCRYCKEYNGIVYHHICKLPQVDAYGVIVEPDHLCPAISNPNVLVDCTAFRKK